MKLVVLLWILDRCEKMFFFFWIKPEAAEAGNLISSHHNPNPFILSS